MMLEPMRVVPVVAIFGIGHVGLELARVLARHEIDLHLIDSRPEMLALERVGEPGGSGIFADAVARVHVTHSPVPEAALMMLPADAHVLVMTHDHVEDLAIVDQSLRADGIRSIGLIGSASKWARFRKKLTELGHGEADLARVTTPIGVSEVSGKQPAVIAVSVAARILQLIDEAAPVAVESTRHADDEPDADGTDAVDQTSDVHRAHR